MPRPHDHDSHDYADDHAAFDARHADRRPGDAARPAADAGAADVDAASASARDASPEVAGLSAAYAGSLRRLMSEIATLPDAQRSRLTDAADEARRRHERLGVTVAKLQETLDFLRLGVKYLVFDIEATKRENAYLRKLLEEAEGDA